MTAVEKFEALRDYVGADSILDELRSWLSSDMLNEFVDDYIKLYDINETELYGTDDE